MKLTRLSGKAILVAAALLLFASSSALAQTQEAAKPASEVDQLKQRLQQLEQTVTGMNITSNLKFTPNDTGRFAFVFGQGIQNYMNDAPVDVGIELTPGGDPRLAFLDHNWSKRSAPRLGIRSWTSTTQTARRRMPTIVVTTRSPTCCSIPRTT